MVMDPMEGMGLIALKPDLTEIELFGADHSHEVFYVRLNRIDDFVFILPGLGLIAKHIVGIDPLVAAWIVASGVLL